MKTLALAFGLFLISFNSHGQTLHPNSCAQLDREAIGQEFVLDAALGAFEALERNGIVVSGMVNDVRFQRARIISGLSGRRVSEVISSGAVRLRTQNGTDLLLRFESNTSQMVRRGNLLFAEITDQLVLLFEDLTSQTFDREGNVTSQAVQCNVDRRQLLNVTVVNEASNKTILAGAPMWGARGFFWTFVGH